MSAARARDGGAVTVEAALGIAALVTVFGLALTGMVVVINQLRCTDAAIEAARLVARGDRQRAEAAVSRLAPPGAKLEVIVHNDQVTTQVRVPAPAGFLPGDPFGSRAHAVLEPGVLTEPSP